MTSPITPTLSDTPAATTVVTPRFRKVWSSDVPMNGDIPCQRAISMSEGWGSNS